MKMIETLGPQNPGDGPLLRRLRLHQSWYRAEVLKLSRWGTTRGRAAKELGSVLSEQDVAAGLNFTSPAAFQLYQARRAEGWGVDPRCTAYMTSSQALTINLVGLLGQDEAWFVDCLNTWLGRSDLRHIARTELEFAPVRRSLHLSDQTRIDVLVVATGDSGPEVIAVEIKYADRFNSRRVDISTPPYHDLARSSGLWTEPSRALTDPRVNQLARVHALATSYARSLGVARPVSLVAVAHEADAAAQEVVSAYAACVNGPLVTLASLRAVCASAVETAPVSQQHSAERFHARYGCEAGSDDVAQELAEARLALPRRGDRSGGRVA